MHWNILTAPAALIAELKQQFKTSDIIAQVMALKGIKSLDQSRQFFNPSLEQLHDPFLMQDMEIAVERILKNKKNKIPILIFGDYDVDGTTSASLLYSGFKKLGIEAKTYIPNREKEGYGLSKGGIDYAGSIGANLLITCDCGINAFKQVEYANSKGIDIIITDHHQTEEILPAALAVLNPHRQDCSYPFKGLCGCGVAYKLLSALVGKTKSDPALLLEVLDLVALATASDMVPLTGENRVLVHFGLHRIAGDFRPGFKFLKQKSNLNKDLNVGQLTFGIAPKINVAGRLGDANRAVELLTTNDDTRAGELADLLIKENKRRQDLQQNVVDEALKMVEEGNLHQEKTLVLASKGWHAGVIGIVASRIKEEYSRPAIIIAIDDQGQAKGSGRSVPQLDLYAALSAVKNTLDGFGGHPMAAGLSISEDKIDEFRRAFIEYAHEKLDVKDLVPKLTLDGELKLSDIDARFMKFLEKLAPFGPGNHKPKFLARDVKIDGNPKIIGNGDHLRFTAKHKGRVIEAVAFNLAHEYEKLIKGSPVDLAFTVETNFWRGKKTIQLNVLDIKA